MKTTKKIGITFDEEPSNQWEANYIIQKQKISRAYFIGLILAMVLFFGLVQSTQPMCSFEFQGNVQGNLETKNINPAFIKDLQISQANGYAKVIVPCRLLEMKRS